MPALVRMRRTVGRLRVDALALPQQLGEMSVVGPRITVAGQLHHGGRRGFGHGIVGPPSPVPVGQLRRDRPLR